MYQFSWFRVIWMKIGQNVHILLLPMLYGYCNIFKWDGIEVESRYFAFSYFIEMEDEEFQFELDIYSYILFILILSFILIWEKNVNVNEKSWQTKDSSLKIIVPSIHFCKLQEDEESWNLKLTVGVRIELQYSFTVRLEWAQRRRLK